MCGRLPVYSPLLDDEEDTEQRDARLFTQSSRGSHQSRAVQEFLQQFTAPTVDQLQELYSHLDRQVIEDMVDVCEGNQAALHDNLQELSKGLGCERIRSPAFSDPNPEAPLGVAALPPQWQEGDCVMAAFEGNWLPAEITACHGVVYTVKWLDDGSSSMVPAHDVRGWCDE